MPVIPRGEVPAPEFGRAWINSPALTLASLRGRVVLLDFWDYTCVNCLRTLPYLREWDTRYRPAGLTIIGVHAPEFFFARTPALVRAAVERYAIRYPVVLDNDFQIWRAFANQCWPAKYLIDQDGFLRYTQFGEGAYVETESAIQELLCEGKPGLDLPPPLPPLRPTDQPGTRCYRVTPELYLGYRRGRIGNSGGFQQDQVANYELELPKKFNPDAFYAAGRWRAHPEFLESGVADSAASARVALVYTAKEVNLVMAPTAQPEYRVVLTQDGQPVARGDAGDDVSYDEQGRSLVRVDEPRMYNLVRNAEFGSRRLELATTAAGLGLFAFTFVTCPAD